MFIVFIKIFDAIYPTSCSFINEGICWKNTMCMNNDCINFMGWRKLALFCGAKFGTKMWYQKSGIG